MSSFKTRVAHAMVGFAFIGTVIGGSVVATPSADAARVIVPQARVGTTSVVQPNTSASFIRWKNSSDSNAPVMGRRHMTTDAYPIYPGHTFPKGTRYIRATFQHKACNAALRTYVCVERKWTKIAAYPAEVLASRYWHVKSV
jgi:hypothetical protein